MLYEVITLADEEHAPFHARVLDVIAVGQLLLGFRLEGGYRDNKSFRNYFSESREWVV